MGKVAEVNRYREKGVTVQGACLRAGVSSCSYYTYMNEYGIKPPRVRALYGGRVADPPSSLPVGDWSDYRDKVNEANDLRRQGATVVEACEMVRMKQHDYYKAAKMLGITPACAPEHEGRQRARQMVRSGRRAASYEPEVSPPAAAPVYKEADAAVEEESPGVKRQDIVELVRALAAGGDRDGVARHRAFVVDISSQLASLQSSIAEFLEGTDDNQ